MNFLEKIFEKLSFTWKGNKKKISKQEDGKLQIQQEKSGIVNIFNIENISVPQIHELTSFDLQTESNNLLGVTQKRFITLNR